MRTFKEHDLALCKSCSRAIYVWFDWSMVPIGEADDWADAVDYHWTHWIHPTDGHDAVPKPSLRDRVLACAMCRQPQQHDDHGWHCGNPQCPGVDKD